MKILIAGLGSIGRRHLYNLLALKAAGWVDPEICLLRTRRSTLPEADLAEFPVETDLDAALAWKPQAVIIANPTALHLDIAIPAAAAGCALLIEKPLSQSLERVEQLQTAAERSGAAILVGYHFRYHPGLQCVANLLDAGAADPLAWPGRPLSFRAHWGEYLPGWHPWEDYRQGYSARSELGGGVILTLSHPLDYIRWLFGEVDALWAFAAHLSDLEMDVEDTAEIGLKMKSGVLGSVHLDYNQQPSEHWLEIIGTRGWLRWENGTGAVTLTRPDTHPAQQHFLPPANFERNTLFLDEMRHFLAVARRESVPACTLQDGVAALELAQAALQSARGENRVTWMRNYGK